MHSHESNSVGILVGLLIATSLIASQRKPTQPPEPPLEERDINTALMESTFKIEGPATQGKTLGTAFVMGRPTSDSKNLRYVLITAAHVLEGIQGDTATLSLRRKITESNWIRVPTLLRIRQDGRPLWTKHPNADVAVMYIQVPPGVVFPLLSTDFLADDKTLSDFEIHPGDSLNVLGFPLGMESNEVGFPILRSGRIASYPLLPTEITRSFLLDFMVFKGNSGGPAYLVESTRVFHGATHVGTVSFIAGLVTQETSFNEQLVGIYSSETHQYQLGLAGIVHASIIKQTITMLPSPDLYPH
jgi:S1-C subfamily serine protease